MKIENSMNPTYWMKKFKLIAKSPLRIVHKFKKHLELYIYLDELFFATRNTKLILSLHKILVVLVRNNINYFFQTEHFGQDSGAPDHILSHFLIYCYFGI